MQYPKRESEKNALNIRIDKQHPTGRTPGIRGTVSHFLTCNYQLFYISLVGTPETSEERSA